MVQPARSLVHRYSVPRRSAEWLIPEEPVPESQPHGIVLDLLKALLLAFVARKKMDARVARNLAVRFTAENPRVGAEPDRFLISPRTPQGDDLETFELTCAGDRPAYSAVLGAWLHVVDDELEAGLARRP